MNKPISNWSTTARRPRSRDMLSAEEEHRLLCDWQQKGDFAARDRLLRAFAPMAAAAARRFSPGGAEPDPDLVQQANLGLMKAADRFDPDRGHRFATYAVWWIRAEIQSYNWANSSVVRRPNSAETRKLGTQIRRLDAALAADPQADSATAERQIAEALGLSPRKLADLRGLLGGADSSLNGFAGDADGAERITLLVDPASIELSPRVDRLDLAILRKALIRAMAHLPARERDIVLATQLAEPAQTLDQLGARHGISRERVRQLRERGLERLRAALRRDSVTPDCFV